MSTLEGLKVLLVDDEPFIRSTIKAVLRAIDRFEVKEADDGDTALDLWTSSTGPMFRAARHLDAAHRADCSSSPGRATIPPRICAVPVVILTGSPMRRLCTDAIRLQVESLPGQADLPEGAGSVPCGTISPIALCRFRYRNEASCRLSGSSTDDGRRSACIGPVAPFPTVMAGLDPAVFSVRAAAGANRTSRVSRARRMTARLLPDRLASACLAPFDRLRPRATAPASATGTNA